MIKIVMIIGLSLLSIICTRWLLIFMHKNPYSCFYNTRYTGIEKLVTIIPGINIVSIIVVCIVDMILKINIFKNEEE